MAYEKYYENGWQNNEEGATPITAAALNHMEEGIVDLDEQVSDLNSNSSYSGSHYRIYKKGSLVELSVGESASITHNINQWNTLFIIPTGYRPKIEINCIAYNNSASSADPKSCVCECRISTNGEVKIWPYVTNFQTYLHTTYFVS